MKRVRPKATQHTIANLEIRQNFARVPLVRIAAVLAASYQLAPKALWNVESKADDA
jgi:hypothetical protein